MAMQGSTNKPLLQAAGVMGGFTAVSRVLGFLRDFLIAAFYGTSSAAQAFVVAFRIPNLFRDLVGEGAANTALVPVFSRIRTLEGEDSWRRLAQAVWIRTLVGFSLLCAAGVWAAPWLVKMVAPGFRGDPALLERTVQLTRILFPFIGLVGAAAFFMALLNSRHQFALPALGPVLLNLCMIGGIFLHRPNALGLAWGVIAGGILQLAVQWPGVRRCGVPLGFKRAHHPGVAQIRQFLLPRLFGTGVYQMGALVDTLFASFSSLVGSGGIAALYFAHRFLHLPLALFGISAAQAALPAMASHVAAEQIPEVRRACLWALRSSLFIAIPSSVGLIALGRPIIQTLLERGAFSAESTELTVAAIRWYALGLGAMCAAKVLANTLYAFHDTWTPVRSAAGALAVNVVFNLLLIWPMGLGGIALATSLSNGWNSWTLYTALRRRIGPFQAGLREWMLRVGAASLGMGLISVGIWSAGGRLLGLKSSFEAVGWLLLTIAAGMGSFFLLGNLLQVEEARRISLWLFKVKRKK